MIVLTKDFSNVQQLSRSTFAGLIAKPLRLMLIVTLAWSIAGSLEQKTVRTFTIKNEVVVQQLLQKILNFEPSPFIVNTHLFQDVIRGH